ncbi:MerR family transcriptional regulator [Lihuaxuella thermophila]|uniref:DNA-binding transcriptional regulator, MerR family n=1 Tax=Lihuaxuella thermophila TaxID=1173111 RepID=A0A1H8CSC1_9BACL|nr:MerR family transcriptional regulator [Lihuaxuella thermophila]SEM97880.1 DNA-binding transcriptional regulator, MerR family [Lihuaxuella thermophila]
MKVRPIDIAKKLSVSTSALRHYEEWGIVPPVPRGPNGYRLYTEEHVAYFECIRAMAPVFGMTLTKQVMKHIQRKELDQAFWLVNEAQATLHQEKTVTEKTIEILETEELETIHSKKRKWMSIGEASRETSVPASAIRHWEKMGLISIPRDKENGYRRFGHAQVRRILLIRTLRTAHYPLDLIRKLIHKLDHDQIEQAKKIARDSLENLNRKNQGQLRGIHYLYRLCQVAKLLD